MMAKETGKHVVKVAARFLSGELKTLTREEQLSLAASCVAQAEAEKESIRAWGYETDKGLVAMAFWDHGKACINLEEGWRITRVLITRADKRLTKRKRG